MKTTTEKKIHHNKALVNDINHSEEAFNRANEMNKNKNHKIHTQIDLSKNEIGNHIINRCQNLIQNGDCNHRCKESKIKRR